MGSLKEQISEAIHFMPLHRKKFVRSTTLNLDLLLDDARSTGGIDAGTLDLILMGYRYTFPFRAFLNNFLKDPKDASGRSNKALSPHELEDFFQVVFAALMTRTQIPAPVMVFEAVEFASKHFSPFVKGVSNAFFREVLRQKEALENHLRENPELMLGPELLTRFKGFDKDSRKLGSLLLERPESGIQAFSKAFPQLRKVGAQDFQNKTDPLQAMDPGSWDYCCWALAAIQKYLADSAATETPTYVDILDACAAPGGKLIATYTLLESRGSVQSDKSQVRINRIIATDSKHPRLERLKGNLNRFGLSEPLVECRLHAWGEDAAIQETFDVIFADLPCSGLGTLHTIPDLLCEKISEKVVALKSLQASILKSLLPQLKKGALLFVSLCSVDPFENQHIVKTLNDLKALKPELEVLAEFDSFTRSDAVRVEGIRGWLLRG
jgi:hypothetical protein